MFLATEKKTIKSTEPTIIINDEAKFQQLDMALSNLNTQSVDQGFQSQDTYSFKENKKQNFLKKLLTGLNYDYDSLFDNPNKRLKDNLWGGGFAFCNHDGTNAKVIPVGEWFFSYSDALSTSISFNVNSANKISPGFGFKFLCFGGGYGDGFFRIMLNDKTLRKTWNIFHSTVLFLEPGTYLYQFAKKAVNVGIFLNYLNKAFFSVTVNHHKQHKWRPAISFHFDSNIVFIAIYAVFMHSIRIHSSFFQESLICIFSYENDEQEDTILIEPRKMTLVFFINLIQTILALTNFNNIFGRINKHLNFIIFYQYKTNLIAAIIFKFGGFQAVVCFGYKNGEFVPTFILSLKYSENTSVLNWLQEKDEKISSQTY